MQEVLGSISMDGDGSLRVAASDAGEVTCLSFQAIAELGLFDEGRPNFSYEGDSERAASLLVWRLEDAGYEVSDFTEFTKVVARLCSPGPGGPVDPGQFYVNLQTTEKVEFIVVAIGVGSGKILLAYDREHEGGYDFFLHPIETGNDGVKLGDVLMLDPEPFMGNALTPSLLKNALKPRYGHKINN